MSENLYIKTDKQVPLIELENRMKKFRKIMDDKNPRWQMAMIISKVNMFYFTGTMQEGILIIPRDDRAVLWVRRSYERAAEESLFQEIRAMKSYRDAAASTSKIPEKIYMETEIVPLAMYERIQKYFPFKEVRSADKQISAARAVKSSYELDLMEQSGRIHRKVLEDIMPGILEEGMDEAELSARMYLLMVKEGYHGVSRFDMFDTEIVMGQIGFGEGSLYPSYFNGPGGAYGMSPAVPILGSRDRKLKKGDLVFIDTGCGYEGYHTDKTMTYMFGSSIPDEAISVHEKCVEIQNIIAKMLKPGEIPSHIYNSIMDGLDKEFLRGFMGFKKRKVKFLGHGIGLHVNEAPIIAEGFNEPLLEGMVFALEPKKGVENVGMMGIENTFIVTPEGGRCITGDNTGLIKVY